MGCESYSPILSRHKYNATPGSRERPAFFKNEIMAFTMTDSELLQLKKDLLKDYDKQARKYNKLSKTYLEKYKHQAERCNRLIAEIDNLKNKIENTKTVVF